MKLSEQLQKLLWFAGVRDWYLLPLHSARSGRCSCCSAKCTRVGKHPRTKHGLKDATTDADQIRRWHETWPDANWAARTGAESGLYVLDIDPRHSGNETFELLEKGHGKLPVTLMQRTGGGGLHYFFRHPGGLWPNSTGDETHGLGPGLDTRGDGGYIIIEPSVHLSGNPYEFIDQSTPLADIPEWLLELLEKLTNERSSKPVVITNRHKIPEGSRDATLTSIAGTVRGRGLDADEIAVLLQVVNKKRCVPPLPDFDVQRIAQSIGNYPSEGLKLVRDEAQAQQKAREKRHKVSNLLAALDAYLTVIDFDKERKPGLEALMIEARDCGPEEWFSRKRETLGKHLRGRDLSDGAYAKAWQREWPLIEAELIKCDRVLVERKQGERQGQKNPCTEYSTRLNQICLEIVQLSPSMGKGVTRWNKMLMAAAIVDESVPRGYHPQFTHLPPTPFEEGSPEERAMIERASTPEARAEQALKSATQRRWRLALKTCKSEDDLTTERMAIHASIETYIADTHPVPKKKRSVPNVDYTSGKDTLEQDRENLSRGSKVSALSHLPESSKRENPTVLRDSRRCERDKLSRSQHDGEKGQESVFEEFTL